MQVLFLMFTAFSFRAISALKHRSPVLPRLHLSSGPTIFTEPSYRIQDAYTKAAQWLAFNGVDDAEDSARHIIAHVCAIGTRYSDFIKAQNNMVTNHQLIHYQECLIRRTKSEPVQYIIGNWDFFGQTFLCQSPVLIPRPETEELVQHVIDQLKIVHKAGFYLRILDIGAGTGAIGITLLLQAAALGLNITVTSIDINKVAVALANANAERLLSKNSLRNHYSCLHQSLEQFSQEETNYNQFDVIVSNPPYIPSAEIPGLQKEITIYESEVALDGGTDGLDIIKQIMNYGPKLMKAGGPKQIWLEVDTKHPSMIRQMIDRGEYPQFQGIETYNDLSQNPRFVYLQA